MRRPMPRPIHWNIQVKKFTIGSSMAFPPSTRRIPPLPASRPLGQSVKP